MAAVGHDGLRGLSAMKSHSVFFFIAAIHFYARSGAVIDPREFRFSEWPAGMQRPVVFGCKLHFYIDLATDT